MTQKSIGIVIQGPLKSYGQGPVQSAEGYNATHDILETSDRLAALGIRFVISGWHGERKRAGMLIPTSGAWVESQLPDKDPDNRKKQFVSTWAGFEYLRNTLSPPEYIFKIRTDQVWPEDFFRWLIEERPVKGSSVSRVQRDYLLFSDSMIDQPYYLGDFVMGGCAADFQRFLRSFLDYPIGKVAHPIIGYDYVMRYLMQDSDFKSNIVRAIPLWWQAAHSHSEAPLQQFWRNARRSMFSLVPREHFSSMRWRGIMVKEALGLAALENFSFNEDWHNWELESSFDSPKSKIAISRAIFPDHCTVNMASDICRRSVRKIGKKIGSASISVLTSE